MDETATRRKKIDPKLYEVGWEQVPESEILTEQRAYVIAPGKVSRLSVNRHPKKADYILVYKKQKLAVIEAKSDEKDVSEGVAQAKLYAELLKIRFAYSSNGDQIWAIDMGVKDAQGNYVIPSKEGPADRFPSPQELWQMTFPDVNPWRDRFNLQPLNRGGGREPRYYQEIAINRVLEAIAKGEERILLTMATGTGKTYTAFQICWKLYQTNWNLRGVDQKPRILFISDRNILANQAKNDFEQFPEDAMERITPELLHDKKHRDRVPKARHLYFTIFQTFMANDPSGTPFFMQYPPDFFDFIIIDECHRGGANDESEWRQVMEYFKPAVQLGMTATPRRKVNANTYKYFGDPVYSYSLKQGIEDGFLTPFRVKIATSNIDDYHFEPDDDVEQGEIDTAKTYTEQDFYAGNIEIRQRDEHRVKELLGQIRPDDKTLVFCCTQRHAMIIRDMINRWKTVPDANYCERVTADDGAEGEKKLKLFQNNDMLRPTILTTSQKLSTGVDARNVRNIVLMRPVNNIVEFKQILGRGTRLFDGKYYFTLIDFVGASQVFKDKDWDGEDPYCPDCGNYPCSCGRTPKVCSQCGKNPCECPPPPPPEPCPVCGNLPCTCEGTGGVPRRTIKVKLSNERELRLYTLWDERVQFGDEMLSLAEYVKRLFGALPKFLQGEDDLRERWSQPDTREQLLDVLAQSGFPEDKLEMTRRILALDDCDMLDVLSFLAYHTTPIDRQRRAEILMEQARKEYTQAQLDFVNYVMELYVRNGFKELGNDKLPTLINMKYHSPVDAVNKLKMQPQQIRDFYLGMQQLLYNGQGVANLTIENHFHGSIDQITINE
jgi:type I restriction enzyme R subunit